MPGLGATREKHRLPGAFNLLFAGETVSLFGTQVTMVALPLTASVMLHADQLAMGALSAVGWLPVLLFGFVAGTYVDRLRGKWRVLLVSDLARALILGLIPLLAAVGGLSLAVLLAVAFTAGIANVVFDVTYQTYTPSLVSSPQLAVANSRYEVSRSVAQLAGPLAGGALASVILPAYAVGIDAASFVAAAVGLCLMRLRRLRGDPAAQPAPIAPGQSFRADLVAGQRIVWRSAALRMIVLSGAVANVFVSGIDALLVLFVTRTLGLGSLMVGISLACAGAGALGGALLYQQAYRLNGDRGCIAAGLALIACGSLLLPCAVITAPVAFLVCSQLLIGGGNPILNIALVTMRQKITPGHLLGRVNASARVLIMSSLPVGSLLGGILAQEAGTTPALWACGAGLAVLISITGRKILTLPVTPLGLGQLWLRGPGFCC